MKNNVMVYSFLLVIVALIVAGTFIAVNKEDATGTLALTGQTLSEDGTALEGKWTDSDVPFEVKTKKMFDTSTNVASTGKLFTSMPTGWEGENVDFTDSALYTSYTATAGVITFDDQKPGTYYVVLEATGYNKVFYVLDITDGTGHDESLSEYTTAPESDTVQMSLVGSTTDVDYALTLVNDTDASVTATITLDVGENTLLKGYKVVVTDVEGFATDTDYNGVFDEGVDKYTMFIEGIEYLVFEADNVDSPLDKNNADATFLLGDFERQDQDTISIRIEIESATGDYTGANDEVWGEGEGILSQIIIYDDEGSVFSTTDVVA